MPSDAITADPPTIWPLYEGTKRLRATPMDRANYCALRGWTVPADEDPREPGYTVEYRDGGKPNVEGFDGYVSWSPADVFERSYRRLTPISDGSSGSPASNPRLRPPTAAAPRVLSPSASPWTTSRRRSPARITRPATTSTARAPPTRLNSVARPRLPA
jgi:hypothetical protein